MTRIVIIIINRCCISIRDKLRRHMWLLAADSSPRGEEQYKKCGDEYDMGKVLIHYREVHISSSLGETD